MKQFSQLFTHTAGTETRKFPQLFIVLNHSNSFGKFAIDTYIVVRRNAQRCQVKITF